ncbi:MAG: DUF421 domain-containing protein [Verrucomicrobia bacterium]|nr:MAG: DUF421 domain-containing protein [Verrucomicrobiota bacterium]
MSFYASLSTLLGLDLQAKELSLLQVSLRGIIVFLATLVMVRLGNKRFLAKMTAFDAILGFILASMLARAVNGSSPFFPTLGCGFVLVFLHRLIAAIAFYWKGFGALVKGQSEILVEDGKLNEEALRSHKISEDDLLEEARLHGRVDHIRQIQEATLERNGQVSVIPQKR